jgi:predicted lipoprotein with Yx(FWY)xxD motif
MRRHGLSLMAVAALVVLVAGCGSGSATGSGGAAVGGKQASVVQAAKNSKLGTDVLENSKGMTLYTLSAETNGRFICTQTSTIPGGNTPCLSFWIPLTVKSMAAPSGPVSGLGTIQRPDTGAVQLTYQGHPLYTFAGDKAPGDASGNGFKDVGTWQAAVVGGQAASSSGGSTGSTGPYGY